MKIFRRDSFRAAGILIFLLHICFFSSLWGKRTLLASAQDSASITARGAWVGQTAPVRFPKVLDAGGGGYESEPLLPLIGYQYLKEHVAPLWNPYVGLGCPLAANQQSQPFFPLTIALSLHITPRTYNWFIVSRLFLAGLCSYLFMRFFVSFWAAMAAGVTSTLAGYYVLFINMPQLSVEVLLPAGLLAGEYLLRKRSYRAIATFAAVLLLIFVGGMPESALILFTLLYAYMLFRLISDANLRPFWFHALGSIAAGTGTGLALSAFQLLPFWEFMHRSFDVHQPSNTGGAITGLVHDAAGASLFTYIFPLLYGPPFSTVLGPSDFGLRNYVGLISVALIFMAVGAAVGKRDQQAKSGTLAALTWFFSAVSLLVVLKRYGFPLINMLGALSFYQLVNFPKYEEALLSISVSMLAAIAVERLIRREVAFTVQIASVGLAGLLIPAALLYSRPILRHEILDLHIKAKIPITAIAVPVLLLLILGIVLARLQSRSADAKVHARIGFKLVAILSAEMYLNFVAPNYSWFNRLPFLSHDPYKGAPYISKIENEEGNYRIFANDGLLFPNWAAAFRVFDIRALDAMYERKYFPFLRNFFPGYKDSNSSSDLVDRFNGTGIYDLTAPLAKRLLQLTSVKYLATTRALVVPDATITEIISQNQGRLLPGREVAIGRREFILDGEGRDGLGEHPPYERLSYRLHVGAESREIFDFSYALDPFVFDKTSGDGVEFLIEVKDPRGRITKQFSQYIDPKHNLRERHWMDGHLDLSAYRDQTIELLFSTTPGPKGDTSYDWAAWSNLHFEGAAHTASEQPFQVIYSAEANIYRFDNVLPRAAIYHHVELVGNEEQGLRMLAEPSFDVFQGVVLNASAWDARQRAAVMAVNQQTPSLVETAAIRSYASQDVRIEATLDRSGILVLNDTDYPGWTVTIDGQPGEVLNANYMFRGVLLTAGKHAVRFAYQPKSFYLGAKISGAALLMLLAAGVLNVMRRTNSREPSLTPPTPARPLPARMV